MSSIRRLLVASLACFAIAQAAYSLQGAAQLSAPEVVTADAHRTSPGGATFTVPAGWSIAIGKNVMVVGPPETDTHIAIVNPTAKDANAAVEESWTAYKPEAKHPLKIATPRPARNGWDERQIFDYEVSPNERAFVQAVALRAGNAWTVVLLDGSDMTFEKRAAPINL